MEKRTRSNSEKKTTDHREVQEKKFLRPSDQVLNRIRWDPSFDVTKLTIGYLDRFDGEMVCDIDIFDLGEIPFHRIWWFKLDDLLVWDRETKLDLISFGECLDVKKETSAPIVQNDIKKKKTKC
jgi:uncharacterized protein (UPF0248 family)